MELQSVRLGGVVPLGKQGLAVARGWMEEGGGYYHLARQRHLAQASICISIPLTYCCCYAHAHTYTLPKHRSPSTRQCRLASWNAVVITHTNINMKHLFPSPICSQRRQRPYEPKGNTKRNPRSLLCQRRSIQVPLCSTPRTSTSTISPAQTRSLSLR